MRGWEVLRFEESGGEPVGDIIRFMTNVEYRLRVAACIAVRSCLTMRQFCLLNA